MKNRSIFTISDFGMKQSWNVYWHGQTHRSMASMACDGF